MKIIIIGGGVAGLTAGVFALERGAKVTLVEKNKTCAGALCGWRRGGYEIDGCLHWLTGTKEGSELYDIWMKTGMLDGEVVKTEAFFTSETDGGSISFYRDAKRTEEEMIALSPEDREEVRKLFRAVKAASAVGGADMKRRDIVMTLAPYSMLNAGEVALRFKNRTLRRAICDLTGKVFSSLGFIFAYSAYASGNGYLPRGGSRGGAERMIKRFGELGGEYISGKTASSAVRRNGEWSVSFQDGGYVAGDSIICAAEPLTAVSALFGEEHIPRGFEKKRSRRDKYPLFSSVHIALAAKTKDVPFKGTVFFPCRRHSVGTVNRDRMMLREFSHEPSFAPEGMSVMQTMIVTGERESGRWIDLARCGGYEEAKSAAAEEIKERIAERFPSLSGAKVIDSWTPATFSRYLSSVSGTYMPFALTPATVPASFPMRLPRLEKVYFASGWSRSPGGVPNAAYAGRDAALLALADSRLY